jgi:hypothetical protein
MGHRDVECFLEYVEPVKDPVPVIGAFAVLSDHILDNKLVFEITCSDFNHYKSLPEVLSYKGIQCIKGGWSSDTQKCCYQQSKKIARAK